MKRVALRAARFFVRFEGGWIGSKKNGSEGGLTAVSVSVVCGLRAAYFWPGIRMK